jgi:hypothetical protein
LLTATVVPMLLAFSWAGSKYEWASVQIVGLLSWAVVGLAMFTYAELRAEEPILPMKLFKDRVFTVSALVTLVTGFAMMGSLFYIPLFVQGVIGASATNSGLVTMPMMIAMAISSAISGQVMSRVGRYRVLGVLGIVIMLVGMVTLSQMTVDSTMMDARMAMVIFGVGLGMSIPLFMYAVQNSVPYRYMGISTSSMQFLRAVGGTMGVAIMFSIIQGQYNDSLQENVPPAVTQQPQLSAALEDPQFLLNGAALAQVTEVIGSLPGDGAATLEATILGVRESLAGGITEAFFISIFVLALAVVIALFMKEVPLRKTHLLPEEEAEAGGAPTAEALPLPPIAGGSGHDEPPEQSPRLNVS